jgi:hypothetical protein
LLYVAGSEPTVIKDGSWVFFIERQCALRRPSARRKRRHGVAGDDPLKPCAGGGVREHAANRSHGHAIVESLEETK